MLFDHKLAEKTWLQESFEALVLAHHDPVAATGIIPDLEVEWFVHAEAKDMAGLVSTGCEKAAKGFRELVVHQKIRALVSTT